MVIPKSLSKCHSGHTRILEIQTFIEKQAATINSLQEIAGHFGMSLSTLKRHFQKTVGDTPSHYLLKAKIEIAKDLLETSNLSIQEVAYKVQYESVAAFIRVFKQQMGLTPVQYRKQSSHSAGLSH